MVPNQPSCVQLIPSASYQSMAGALKSTGQAEPVTGMVGYLASQLLGRALTESEPLQNRGDPGDSERW